MTRRKMIASTSTAAALQAQSKAARQYIFVRKIFLRNSADGQAARTSEFLEKATLPALQKVGATGIGIFASALAADTPYFLVIAGFPSLAAMETAMAKVAADKDYAAAQKAFNQKPGLGYVRYETSVLLSFGGFPQIVTPAPGKSARTFELRTYESDDAASLTEKIRMFEEGEIAIFKKTGLEPVFFGETVFGQKQPNLTYMLWFDSLAAREANWAKFVSSPEWQKLRVTPGWSDAEIVSNISTAFLRPLPFSPIR